MALGAGVLEAALGLLAEMTDAQLVQLAVAAPPVVLAGLLLERVSVHNSVWHGRLAGAA